MKLVQVFKAADSQQDIGLIEMTTPVPVPVVGDYVSWPVDGKPTMVR